MFSKIVDKISKMVYLTLIISKQYCVLIHGFSLPWNVDHALRGVLQWLNLVNCLKKEKHSCREKFQDMLMEWKWEDTDIMTEHTSIAAWHGSDLKVHVVLYMALLKIMNSRSRTA